MAKKKTKVPAKPKKAAAKKSTPKKKTVVKKEAAGKKRQEAVKKTAPKKKVTAKKTAPKKKVAAKKTLTVKKVTARKTLTKKVVPVAKPKLVEVAQAESAKSAKSVAKPLSRNQLKKSSAKKRSSERETLLDATYTSNPKTPKNTLPVDPKTFKLAKSIVNAIEEKKGDNVVCIDLRNIENRVCDYFIICDGTSSTQIDAIGGSVEFLVKKELGERPYRSEGYENKTWILIDYVNVIVHVFDKETRHFYNLESLWADGERIKF